MWQKGFCRCDEVKDLEMGRLFWVAQCSHGGPYKERGRRESERGDNRSRGQSDAVAGFELEDGHRPRNVASF